MAANSTREKPISTTQLLAILTEELSAMRKEREANAVPVAPSVQPPPNPGLLELPHKFELFRQASEQTSKTRHEQLQGIEKTLAEDHVKIAKQFDSVSEKIDTLMQADMKLRNDLEKFILTHDAPKIILRLDQVEAKVVTLEKRNAAQDGAALSIKFFIGFLGFLTGLAVKYL